MNTKIMAPSFSTYHTKPGGGTQPIPCQPPKKSVTATVETTMMLAYSARKKNANFMPLYSVWKPATSSVSASGRSKGTRFVSASAAMKNTTKASGRGEEEPTA